MENHFPTIFDRNLPQQAAYFNHCQQVPSPFDLTLEITHGLEPKITQRFLCAGPDASQPLGTGSDHDITSHIKTYLAAGDTFGGVAEPLPALEDSLLMAAAAFTCPAVGHMLDGYSWALVTRIEHDRAKTTLTISGKAVRGDFRNYERENAGGRLRYGMLSGETPTWQKVLCCGRCCQLMTTGRIIEKNTAHQPIYSPAESVAYFAAAGAGPAFKVGWPADPLVPERLKIEEDRRPQIPRSFGCNHYVCMHRSEE